MKELEFSDKKEFIEKVNSLRSGLNIAKNSYNNFGNFKYRSLPDIFSGIQNNLKSAGLYVEITDELISEPLCIKSKAILSDGKNKIESTAHAMIGTKTNKDGKAQMDLSQQTGSATRYARKYACEALFLLADDNCSDSLAGESSSVQKAVQKAPSSPPPSQEFKIEKSADMKDLKETKTEAITCPRCEVGELVEKEKVISCSEWQNNCKFSIWKNGQDLNIDDVKKMCDGDKTRPITMTKKDGSEYEARLYVLDGEVKFDFNCDIPVPVTTEAPF